MRVFVAALLALNVGACNQTVQSEGPEPVAAALPAAPALPPEGQGPQLASSAAGATVPMEDPGTSVYEPLVDMHRVNPDRYQRDLTACRQQAAPQLAAIKRATQQQQTGTAIAVAGTLASYIPVPGFRQAHVLASAANAVQSVGGATAESGAAAVEKASSDYALVVDSCLTHKRYKLLRP
ncbi:hypothetical protein [Bosea robiniae]|uniref:Glycine zipper family protein n=1 Tax=Bosea robiniae TaxID=1036780 RepID=A0ABY0P154_9HYPH|nr:hypothetical protein [Bosea robiniae]SDG70392.1 hypothetical protein SAMN05421844_10523 [Bosea robiniae]